MLFHVYGSNAVYQWIAMLAVLAGLILLNEFSRRTKLGGLHRQLQRFSGTKAAGL